jgi:hypothetical protein
MNRADRITIDTVKNFRTSMSAHCGLQTLLPSDCTTCKFFNKTFRCTVLVRILRRLK